MSKKLSYGSVFSGIEAASAAWHSIGWEPAWFAEIEPFPSAALASLFPEVPNLGDMTKIWEMVENESVEAPDIYVGGSPCQAFSVAGLRKSLEDPRGQLTLEYVRLLDVIDRKRNEHGKQPAICVWENVPGVFTAAGNPFGCFLAALSGEDDALLPPGGRWTNSGYVLGPQRTVAWRVLDAQYQGVAQRRKRVFVVASARTDIDPREILFECNGVRRDSPPSREAWQDAAPVAGARTAGR